MNPRYHRANTLNDLSGTEWIKFTRTWFVCDSPRYHKNKDTEMHPARFPEEMVREFLLFFTKRGGWVLDPFLGSGATLVACEENERRGVGIEVNPRYAKKSESRLRSLFERKQRVIQGNAQRLAKADLWQERREELEAAGLEFKRGLPQFDLAITSPPYWRMLRTSRGGVYSKHKQRGDKGLDTTYSESEEDLANIEDYGKFIAALGGVFDQVCRCLKPGKYLVVVIQNLRTPDGEVKPLAYDLTRRVSRKFSFQGERIWCQNTKPLGIWGYPRIFVPNYHHHYCLIFQKRSAP